MVHWSDNFYASIFFIHSKLSLVPSASRTSSNKLSWPNISLSVVQFTINEGWGAEAGVVWGQGGVWWVFWATKAWTWSRAGGGQAAAASHGWELSKSQTRRAVPQKFTFSFKSKFSFYGVLIGNNLRSFYFCRIKIILLANLGVVELLEICSFAGEAEANRHTKLIAREGK